MATSTNDDKTKRVPLLRPLGAAPVWLWVLLIPISYYLYSPWVFWIGGHFTPSTGWQGNAVMLAANGAPFGLRVDFKANFSPGNRSNSPSRSKSIRGSGAFCTEDGRAGTWKLSGAVKDAWARTNGKSVSLVFSPEHDSALVVTSLSLQGHFAGDSIVVDGSSAPEYIGAAAGDELLRPDEIKGLRGSLQGGDEHEFPPRKVFRCALPNPIGGRYSMIFGRSSRSKISIAHCRPFETGKLFPGISSR